MADTPTKLKYLAGACLLVSFSTGFAGHFGSTEYDMLIEGVRCECKEMAGPPVECPFLVVGVILESLDLFILLYCVGFFTVVMYKDFVTANPMKHSTQAILFLVGWILLLLGSIFMFGSTFLPVMVLTSKQPDPLFKSTNKMRFKHAEKVSCAIFGFVCAALFIKIWLGLKKLATPTPAAGETSTEVA